jgi:hypothetical protein
VLVQALIKEYGPHPQKNAEGKHIGVSTNGWNVIDWPYDGIPKPPQSLCMQILARWKPQLEWELKMEESDKILSRTWEDHILQDHEGQVDGLLGEKFKQKQALRATKPS